MARALVTTANGTIGSIEYSMLTLAQFQTIRGAGWVLANGGSAVGTTYATVTGFTVLPDHRGVAPRGKNNGLASGQWNPGGDLALGTFQDHQNASHTHTSGAGTSFVSTAGAPVGVYSTAGAGPAPFNVQANTAPSAVTGGDESRMKNITLNAFIKVN